MQHKKTNRLKDISLNHFKNICFRCLQIYLKQVNSSASFYTVNILKHERLLVRQAKSMEAIGYPFSLSSLIDIEKKIKQSWEFRSLAGKTQFIPYNFRNGKHYTRMQHTIGVANNVKLFGCQLNQVEQIVGLECEVGGGLNSPLNRNNLELRI